MGKYLWILPMQHVMNLILLKELIEMLISMLEICKNIWTKIMDQMKFLLHWQINVSNSMISNILIKCVLLIILLKNHYMADQKHVLDLGKNGVFLVFKWDLNEAFSAGMDLKDLLK